MNISHMKYAVEIARTGSMNKAAENLYLGQPNLSRAIKELETTLGISIFERGARGMRLTPDGEIFIRYAEAILSQLDSVENMFKSGEAVKRSFSISVPRASYIADAFARFSMYLTDDAQAEIFYKETNSMRTIKNIMEEDYKLAIIRYAEHYDKYYISMMEEKELSYEVISKFHYVLVMNKECALAKKENITFDDLKDYIEIAHADPFVPSLPVAAVKKEELPDNSPRRIFVFERASQFELLSQNPQCFMWVSPTPTGLLERYGLTERGCAENERVYKDILIHRKSYRLSELDKLFVSELAKSTRDTFRQNLINTEV